MAGNAEIFLAMDAEDSGATEILSCKHQFFFFLFQKVLDSFFAKFHKDIYVT